MVRHSISSKLETSPTFHSDRILSVRLQLKSNQHLALFIVYAPTILADRSVIDCYYSDLHRHLNNTPVNDKVLIRGDFNARVWRVSVAWKWVLGRHSVGNCKDIGRLMLEFCTECQHATKNTIFQQKHRLNKTLAPSLVQTLALHYITWE